MPSYYLYKNRENLGPYDEDTFRHYIVGGQIKPHDLVYPVGGSQWVEAKTIEIAAPPEDCPETPPTPSAPVLDRIEAEPSEEKSLTSNLPRRHKHYSRGDFLPTPLASSAWLSILNGVLLLIGSTSLGLVPSLAKYAVVNFTPEEEIVFQMLSIIAICLLLYGTFSVVGGVQLLRRKKIGFRICLILAIIGCLGVNLLSIAVLILCLQSTSQKYFSKHTD